MTGAEIRDAILATLRTQLATTDSGKRILEWSGATIDGRAHDDIIRDQFENLLRNMAGNVAQIVVGWIEEAVEAEVDEIRANHMSADK